ncbi:hypothetical protein PLICRDRAFT_40419 [Plicaturopsis crispa FD-325 SS-3]|nr:hypothetical protein PLICRDRAFT_40419 [Plicaturopsis crispa FD-325 SS-3]
MPGPNDSRYHVAHLLVVGLVFHLVYIGTVFDCYFTSPVVNGMQSYGLQKPEAERLVLIVGDGLRADLLLEVDAFKKVDENAPAVVAPHLRSIVETRGAFGISHTRVPTESRPGHVALIGGMYEDVSAVTKGWKTNPVDFDSVFNRSSHTFSFGSPDILPMFARGATPGKVKTWSYDEDEEDFTKDATALDLWVLDHLRELFHNASTDAALDAQLRSSKTVFFLHLLGLDTTGHSYKPHSKEYMENIRIVDGIVRETEKLFSDFFQDEETSYIFSADHGMANRGNHGDGDPDNTRTPLVAWGRGIRGPLPNSTPSSHDAYSRPWKLDHLLRRDVEQADIASLMAALLGIEWPVNSVGVLPDVDPTLPGYLLPREGDETLARAALVNAQVIFEHYRTKHEIKRAHTLFYTPFQDLERVPKGSNTSLADASIKAIEQHIDEGRWYDARATSAELIKTSLQGLRYLQTYDRLLIRIIVTTAYTGWAAYASLYIFRPVAYGTILIVDALALATLGAFWTMFAIQRAPWSFYVYVAFPCYFWHQVFGRAAPALRAWLKTGRQSYNLYLYAMNAGRGALVVGALQSMVAAYTERKIWSVGLVLIGIAWPLIAWPTATISRKRFLLCGWMLSCLVTAVFPLLPVDKEESLRMVLLGGTLMLLAGLCGLSVVQRQMKHARLSLNNSTYAFFATQILLIVASRLITKSSVLSLRAKLGLPLWNQAGGWVTLTSAAILPFAWPVKHTNVLSKILALFLAFVPCFVILSISVEGLFYLAYSVTLLLWIEVEAVTRGCAHTVQSKPSAAGYQFRVDDVRIALFFLFFVQVAFFGTGNVASISSFYLQPVYRLVPIFSPFLMASLLMFKIIVPYVVLSVCFAALNARLRLPPFSLFLVALTLTDGMTMTFFFNVTDTGSWLEIGQSISFFCITSLLLVWSAGICAAGEYLMKGTLRPHTGIKQE